MKPYNSIGGGTLSQYGNLVNDFLHLILIPTSLFDEFGGVVCSGLFVNCSTDCRILSPKNTNKFQNRKREKLFVERNFHFASGPLNHL